MADGPQRRSPSSTLGAGLQARPHRHLSQSQKDTHQKLFRPSSIVRLKARRLARDTVRCEGCGAWTETAYFDWQNQFWCEDCREETPVRDFSAVARRVAASDNDGDLISDAYKSVKKCHPLHNWFEIDPMQAWWKK